MSHLLDLHLLTIEWDLTWAWGNIDGKISFLKLLPLLYVTLMAPSGNIFFISGSLYNTGKLFLMKACNFFIIGLYTVTKFTLNLWLRFTLPSITSAHIHILCYILCSYIINIYRKIIKMHKTIKTDFSHEKVFWNSVS